MNEKYYKFGVDAGTGKVLIIYVPSQTEIEAWGIVKRLVYQSHNREAPENFIYLYKNL